MIISKSNSEHYQWGNNCDGWHLVKTSALSVIRENVPSGSSEIRHYHEKAEQFFYILSGIATLEVNGKANLLHAEQGLHIKAGVSHQLRNDDNQDLIFLVTSVPPSHGDRIDV